MLLLAKHARLWRRSEEIERKQLVRESLRRWAHLRRQGRLRPLSLALTPTARLALLAAAAGLAERVLWRAAVVRLTAWRAGAAARASRLHLIALFLPYAMRRRAVTALASLRSSTERSLWLSDASARAAVRLGARRMLAAFGAARDASTRSLLMAALAHAMLTARHPPAEKLRSALLDWHQRVRLSALLVSVGWVGARAGASYRLRGALARWRRTAAIGAVAHGALGLGQYEFSTRHARQALEKLQRWRAWWLRREPIVAHGQCASLATAQCARRPNPERVASAYTRRARLTEAMSALRRSVELGHALEWATLHASTRGVRHERRAVLRRWSRAACAARSSHGSAARLARIYALQEPAVRRVWCMSDVLRNGAAETLGVRTLAVLT